MTTLRLILGDQLNSQHSWLSMTDSDVLYVLMEVRQETDYGKRPAVPPVVLHSVGAISGFLRGGGDGKKARRGILAAAS